LILFDVDNTLSRPRQRMSPAMRETLQKLRQQYVIGFLGGSDLAKITEQLTSTGEPVINDFDYGFAENGLTAFKCGQPLPSQSFINFLGEEKYQRLVKYVLHYIADLDIPKKRGTFMEFRNGMVNVSPIGRNCTIEERYEFNAYDQTHKIRETFVKKMREEFSDYGLTFSIGGMISFDAFPNGWDKTYALRHVEDEKFEEIHFFGDKTFEGGNDYEIFIDPRTIGHSVRDPEHTIQILNEEFLKK